MEDLQNIHPESNLVPDNYRNIISSFISQSAINASEYSSKTLILSIIYYTIKISICLYVLIEHPHLTEKPLQRFLTNSIATDLVFAYIILRKYGPDPRSETFNMLYPIGYLYYFSNNLYGNYIYYSCSKCMSENPTLSSLTFWLLMMGNANICLPLILNCYLLMCLNAAIAFLGSAIPSQQTPANEDAINRLVPVNYKLIDNENNEEGCIICTEDFKADELVIYLNCGNNHKFHDSCIKTWLRINSVCPVCRQPID